MWNVYEMKRFSKKVIKILCYHLEIKCMITDGKTNESRRYLIYQHKMHHKVANNLY